MKILYVYYKDPENINSQSGRPYAILRLLRNNGHEVKVLVLPKLYVQFFKGVQLIVNKVMSVNVSLWRGSIVEFGVSVLISLNLIRYKSNVVFSPCADVFRYLGWYKVKKIACVDTLVPGHYEYYPEINSLENKYADFEAQAKCLDDIDYILVPTVWCKNQIQYLDLVKREPLALVWPFGANLNSENNVFDEKSICFRMQRLPQVIITTIVSDWHRKGGDITLSIAEQLAEFGYRVEVNVIGAIHSALQEKNLTKDVKVSWWGRLDKENLEDMKSFTYIMRKSTFFSMPSRGEAFGMSVCEAFAYGIPAIVSTNGGLREIVSDGINGYIINGKDGVAGLAKKLNLLIINKQYEKMAREARNAYENVYNWEKFYEHTFQKIFSEVKY